MDEEEPAEKEEPASDTEDPLEDVEFCVKTGCVHGGEAGGVTTEGYCSNGWKDSGVAGTMGSGAYAGSGGRVAGRDPVERVVNLGHPRIKFLSSGIWILFRASLSKMRLRMKSSSTDNGRIDLKKLGLLR